MPNAKVELFEHTADIGIRVEAQNLEDLFIHCAQGILKYATESFWENLAKNPHLQIEERVFVIEEDTLEELLLRWLNEQIFNLYTYNIIAIDYSLMIRQESGRYVLSSRTRYAKILPEHISSEVKGATRHNLKVEVSESHYKTEVIFDL